MTAWGRAMTMWGRVSDPSRSSAQLDGAFSFSNYKF